MTVPVPCNQCGACCRVGGICVLRGPTWCPDGLNMHFEGRCELLAENNKCMTMLRVIEQGEPGPLKSLYMLGIKGVCDTPDIRVNDYVELDKNVLAR